MPRRERFGWMNIEDLAGGSLGATEGWLDPHALMMAFRAKAAALGVGFEAHEVTGMQLQGSLDLDIDFGWFDEIVWPAMARRVPAFDAIKRGNCWAGHYAVNVLDHNAVIGPHPDVQNLLFANGFSGHGVQQSPAVGRGLAELITHGEYRTLDLSRFRFERFARDELIRELNVI